MRNSRAGLGAVVVKPTIGFTVAAVFVFPAAPDALKQDDVHGTHGSSSLPLSADRVDKVTGADAACVLRCAAFWFSLSAKPGLSPTFAELPGDPLSNSSG